MAKQKHLPNGKERLRLMQKRISNKPTNEAVKPEVKTQAAAKPMPIVKYIDTMNRLYGNSKVDEYGNPETATTRIQQQDRSKKLADTRSANAAAFYKPAKKMSASRSWQIIKQSMSPEEREEWYRDHPEDRPLKITPYKLDEGLTEMLGDDEWWLR